MKIKVKKIAVLGLDLVLILCGVGILTGSTLFVLYAKDLPLPQDFQKVKIVEPTRIYDRTGKVLLYTIFEQEQRQYVPLSQISPYLQKAVIAVEDERFYSHPGIDIKGILRATWVNLKTGKPLQGASTITQQLIRSSFLTRERSLKRKIKEMVLSLELERRYSKDKILEWYLNQIPFGGTIYGAETASLYYFGKTAKELSLSESALLAGLIKAPVKYSPFGQNREKLFQRKDYILKKMYTLGLINKDELEKALKEEPVFRKREKKIPAPHFVLKVREELIKKYGEEYLKSSGLKVITTLDLDIQEKVEESVKKYREYNQQRRTYNSAVVVLNPQTGEVLAYKGSLDFFAQPYPPNCIPGKTCLLDPQFDVLDKGRRQPGSAFKPIVYSVALLKGYSSEYVVLDEPTDFGVWGNKRYQPQNYDGKFRGPVTLRQALAQSLNVPAVKVLMNLAGIKESVEMAKSLGIKSIQENSFFGPAMVLGGIEIRPLELAQAYSVFANGGYRIKPLFIKEVYDKQGRLILRAAQEKERVLPQKVTQELTSILSDIQARIPMFGENSILNIPGVAVKTGTTQEFIDGWTIGYTKDFVVLVWSGNNNYMPTLEGLGVRIAGPIWREITLYLLQETP